MLAATLLLCGLIVLFFGGEILLKGSISIARSLRVSDLFVSAVIIGFGTSMPELMVSSQAAWQGSTDMALGNILGSNIANILLIIGLAALCHPIVIKRRLIANNTWWLLIAAVVLVVLVYSNCLNRYTSIFLLLAIILYIVIFFLSHRRQSLAPNQSVKVYHPSIALLLIIIGFSALLGGANLLVSSAVAIAKTFAVPQSVIGLTVVAIGTSVPEIALAVLASFRRHGDIILGNVLGSNIFNSFFILGTTAMIKPIEVAPHIMHIDIWLMLAASVIMALLVLFTSTISRLIGAILLAAYLLYVMILYL